MAEPIEVTAQDREAAGDLLAFLACRGVEVTDDMRTAANRTHARHRIAAERQAREAERVACAEVAETHAKVGGDSWHAIGQRSSAHDIATAINAHRPVAVGCAPSERPWRVQCPVCPINGPRHTTKAEAIAAWNRRTLAWQDIASAPKDGTFMDLWGHEEGWRTNRPADPKPRRLTSCRWDRQGPTPGDGWYGFVMPDGRRVDTATHFMLIPAPPAKENNDG